MLLDLYFAPALHAPDPGGPGTDWRRQRRLVEEQELAALLLALDL